MSNLSNVTKLNGHSMLSLAMNKDITEGFETMKTNHDSGYSAKSPLSILTMDFNLIVQKFSQWLAAPLPSLNHNTAIQKRQPGTGEWFTQSKSFSDWKIGAGSFIWLHGIREFTQTISK